MFAKIRTFLNGVWSPAWERMGEVEHGTAPLFLFLWGFWYVEELELPHWDSDTPPPPNMGNVFILKCA